MEQRTEVARAVLAPGMLGKLARDGGNAASENHIEILTGSGFFKWKAVLLYVVTAPRFHGGYGPVC